ncbi:MAG: DNA-directed RNA polymerase subunit omega [Clostridia bacterium]|nr:DNA-directed RNA polymerase subunit omega [Clostridia bacterium]
MMIKPTIQELTKGEYNRYELALAAAKGARIITDEYVRQRTEAERAAGVKEGERPIATMIDKELKDEKAVRLSIDRINDGNFVIVDETPDED